MALAVQILSTEQDKITRTIIAASEDEAREATRAMRETPKYITVGTEQATLYLAKAWAKMREHTSPPTGQGHTGRN